MSIKAKFSEKIYNKIMGKERTKSIRKKRVKKI